MKEKKIPYRYYAFISYKREDEKWAKWLQKKLEYYRIPLSVRQNDIRIPKKIRPVFKDTTDLTPGILTEEIRKALETSNYLIVICSPRSANSVWVSKEVKYFIEQGKTDHIIPFIIEGTPNAEDPEKECYPEELRNLPKEDQILGVNIKEMGREAASIKVVAKMFGLRFDTLWQRYKKRRHLIILLTSLAGAILVAAGISVGIYVHRQKEEVKIARTGQAVEKLYSTYLECKALYEAGNYSPAFEKSQETLNMQNQIPDTLRSRFEYVLRMSYDALMTDSLRLTKTYKAEFPAMDHGSMPVLFSDNADKIYVGCSGFTILDGNTGKKINGIGDWPAVIKVSEGRVYLFENNGIDIYDETTLSQISHHSLQQVNGNGYEMIVSASTDGSRLMTVDDGGTYKVFDTSTGNIIREFPGFTAASINHDGRIAAFAKDDGLYLTDVDTGQSIGSHDGEYAADLQFDESGRWLLIYLEKYNTVRILNLETGEDYQLENPDLQESWGNSFNYTGEMYANKYYVSDDGRYLAIGRKVLDMTNGSEVLAFEKDSEPMGIKIFPGATKILQLDLDQKILEYTRKGAPLLQKTNMDFDRLYSEDDSDKRFIIEIGDDFKIRFKDKNGTVKGSITDISGDIFHVSISPDGRYAVVNSVAIPTTLYEISTGLPVQTFPFRTADGSVGFGLFGKDGKLYFNGGSTVYSYNLTPLEQLLKIRTD